METSPVIHLVTDAKGTVIHEVHVQMQELPLGMKALTPEVGAASALRSQCQLVFRSCLQQEQDKQGYLPPPLQESKNLVDGGQGREAARECEFKSGESGVELNENKGSWLCSLGLQRWACQESAMWGEEGWVPYAGLPGRPPSFLLSLYLPYSPQTLRSFPVPVRTAVRTCYIRPCRILASSLRGLLGRRVLWNQPLPPGPVPSPWEMDPQNCHCWRWSR